MMKTPKIRMVAFLAVLGLLSACYPAYQVPVTGGVTPAATLANTQTIPAAPTSTTVPTETQAPATATLPAATPSPTMSMSMPTAAPQIVAPTNSVQEAGVQHISIANFAFSPAIMTVPVGTKVRWTNNDSTKHTVTADSGTFNSGPLDPGQTFAVVFSQPGTYTYHCQIHPKMVGTITVTSGSATNGGSSSNSGMNGSSGNGSGGNNGSGSNGGMNGSSGGSSGGNSGSGGYHY